MKNLLISIMLIQFAILTTHGQTRYGLGSGTAGVDYSYFGVGSGGVATNASVYNSFFGTYCGRHTTTGDGNTGIGNSALDENTEGRWNTALGYEALRENTTGDYNVAIGRWNLRDNATGNNNTSIGYISLIDNTTGFENTAVGWLTLTNNVYEYRNVAIGAWAGITGSNNTGIGELALGISGGGNSALGFHALAGYGSNNTGFGSETLYSFNYQGSYNYTCGLGAKSGKWDEGDHATSFTNSAAFGYYAKLTDSNQVRFGNSDVTSIGGQVSWSVLSDGRFKKNVKPSSIGLDFVRQLKPVSYVIDKNAYDKFLGIPDSIIAKSAQARKAPQRQMGFVAQEVDAVVKKHGYIFSGVDEPQNERDPYTIRYADFVMPLVKAVQELSALADARQKKIASLKEKISSYQAAKAEQDKRASGASLYQNNPNPFSISTEIKIALPETTSQASIVIYNLEGKQLKDLRVEDRGTTALKVSATDLKPGMYLYTLIADGKVVDTKRLIIR
jgi:trimeric autotransporter adhesin